MSDYNEGKFQGRVNIFDPVTNNTEVVDLSKRYWVLSWSGYYPEGGFSDVKFTSDDQEEAGKQIGKILEVSGNDEGQCELWDMQERQMMRGFKLL